MPMKILAHRGLWRNPNDKNSLAAIAEAIDSGFGIETDVRDCAGRLVISHNPPVGCEPYFEAFIELASHTEMPVAINIKSDGLGEHIGMLARKFSLKSWFVFDMSVPDMLCQGDNPCFTRLSDVETVPILPDKACGIWLDAFFGMWYDGDLLLSLLGKKTVCVVSEELHDRDYHAQWQMLKQFSPYDNLYLCTDLPLQARDYLECKL